MLGAMVVFRLWDRTSMFVIGTSRVDSLTSATAKRWFPGNGLCSKILFFSAYLSNLGIDLYFPPWYFYSSGIILNSSSLSDGVLVCCIKAYTPNVFFKGVNGAVDISYLNYFLV